MTRLQSACIAVLLLGAAAGCAASATPAQFRDMTVPAGTVLALRLETAIASDASHVDDPIRATLAQALLIDGVEVIPAGSVVTGVVTSAEASGKIKGRAVLAVRFASISVAGRDGTYTVTAAWQHTAAATKGDDAKTIGIPAAGGAVVGALVGGKKGAGIGALIGGGAGTAVVLATSGDEVRLASGAAMSVTLDRAIDVRVPIAR